jgi:hypothetical protein
LDAQTRAYFEPRFGHDFSKVRVHTDTEAAMSAHAVNALAYTVGHHVVFATNRYNAATPGGLRLLAHELTHVAQQERSAISPWSPGIDSIPGGGQSVRILPPIGESGDTFERAADSAADHATKEPIERSHSPHLSSPALQRVELPKPVPICGATVTDIDVLPPRPRGLVECGLPPTVMVTRVNIVGRQRTPASMGRGRIIFNLHVGYYRDPATKRLCAVVSDSQRCLTPGGCIHLGCLPTLEEIVDEVLSLLKGLGIIILAILAVLILHGLRFPVEDVPVEGGPLGPPVLAGGPEQKRPGSFEA